MTTNDATPREAIARAMTSDFSQKVWDGEFNPSPDLGYNRAVREHVRNDFLADADAVIAHLWQAADDPAVVEAALDAAEAANDLYPLDGEPNSVWQARYFSASFAAFLEQLIGPRPQENDDERLARAAHDTNDR